jgi:hypothetical protein
VVVGNGDSNEEAGDSDEEFRSGYQMPFQATCLHHPYPVKHKRKDCTMMKKFMTSGTFSKGGKPGGDLGGKGVAPNPGEAKVMTIFD